MKSDRTVCVSVHLYSTCPYKGVISVFFIVKVIVIELFLKIKCY